MPRGVKKENLPSKICVTCNRPFTWRKKWEKVWDEVTTCSKSCNRKRREKNAVERKKNAFAMASQTDISGDMQIETREGDSDDDCNIDTTCSSNTNTNTDHEVDTIDSTDEVGFDPNADVQELMKDLDISSNEESDFSSEAPVLTEKERRKAEKKRKKAERRAKRQGKDPSQGQKPCDMCSKKVDLLIRCQYDESQQWKMVCGKCWNIASGGVVDGSPSHPYYKYGGLWKNRRRK